MSRGRDHQEIITRELADYPEVTHRIEMGGKHGRLVITYRGKSRFVVLPCTPGDPRGALNAGAWLRRELRNLTQ